MFASGHTPTMIESPLTRAWCASRDGHCQITPQPNAFPANPKPLEFARIAVDPGPPQLRCYRPRRPRITAVWRRRAVGLKRVLGGWLLRAQAGSPRCIRRPGSSRWRTGGLAAKAYAAIRLPRAIAGTATQQRSEGETTGILSTARSHTRLRPAAGRAPSSKHSKETTP